MTNGWAQLDEALAAARAQIAAAPPDASIAAEGEAYVARILTASLNDAFIGHLFIDRGLSKALPTRGCPNPDYLMSHAPVDASQHYRIEGQLNASERVGALCEMGWRRWIWGAKAGRDISRRTSSPTILTNSTDGILCHRRF